MWALIMLVSTQYGIFVTVPGFETEKLCRAAAYKIQKEFGGKADILAKEPYSTCVVQTKIVPDTVVREQNKVRCWIKNEEVDCNSVEINGLIISGQKK